MSFENEDQHLMDQSTYHELQKKLKISYTREFLLSLSELDICKELPSGFDRSILSEFEDGSQDRQRSAGGLSMHNFRRNEYGSSPPSRGDMSSYSRVIQGRWETRSLGRSDKDSDSQSEWDSDSGKHFGNQPHRSWQGSEHDGLLGSGSFPRPSGYAPALSASKFRGNGHYQLNRSDEPYHPPRPYKAPHSRRDTNDSYNDETFGSPDYTSEDRVEEERKRRASFELMRKEQQKAFQEKQKLNPDKNKDEFDITLLLDDDEKRLVSRTNESVEPPVTLLASSNDMEKSSFLPHTPSAARPLVPPGFKSAVLEKNSVTKSSANTNATEVVLPEIGNTRGNYAGDVNSENTEQKSSTRQADIDQQHLGSMSPNVAENNDQEKTLNITVTSAVNVSDIKIGSGDQYRKRSALSEAMEASDDSEVIQLNAEVKGKQTIGALNPVNSNSILDKLFGNVLTLNGGSSTSGVEPDRKADETWSPHGFQSSKFAHWFVEEEKKPVDDLTHRPNDLLSLIVGSEKVGLQLPDVKTTQQSAPDFPFQNDQPAVGRVTSHDAYTTIGNYEKSYSTDKPEVVQAVLTCEDLEQSILSQVNKNGSSLQPMQEIDIVEKTKQPISNIDDHASQHLLSLLQKGTSHKEVELTSILDVNSTDNVNDTGGVTVGNMLDNPGEANADVSNSLKSLTLETLFGTAFMKELQSVGAPLSVQRGAVGSAGGNEPLLFPFPVSDNGLPPSASGHGLSRHGSGALPSEKIHRLKPNTFEEQLLSCDDPQHDASFSLVRGEFPKAGGFDGPTDIHLPEEDSLISIGDPLQHIISAGNSIKSELSQDTPVDIAGKLAAFSPVFRDEQPIVGNQEGLAYPRGPYDMREPGIPYQNLNIQRSSPQLHSSQLNHMGSMLNQLDSHPPHVSSYLKLMTPEGMVHHDPPPNHKFPGNMLHPPFPQPGTGLTGYDPPAHHSMLQQMHMPGNLLPPHLLRGFPRGAPLPAHPGNPMTGFMQDQNPIQGFPFSGHQQPNFGGPGMQLPAPDVAGGRNHPEALQRLFEMELRSKSKPIHPLAAGGHSQGMYGQELDLGFGYR